MDQHVLDLSSFQFHEHASIDSTTTRSAWVRSAVRLAVHVPALALVYLAAFYIRFDGHVPAELWAKAQETLPLVLLVKLAVLGILGSHRIWWRYATFADLLSLSLAATLATGFVAVSGLALPGLVPTLPSVLLLDWAGTLFALAGPRAVSRLVRESRIGREGENPERRVLVVGAGEAGEALVRTTRCHPRLGLRVVGLLDPDHSTHGRRLAGVPVLGPPSEIQRIAERAGIDLVLTPTAAIPAKDLRALRAACAASALPVQVVPGVEALLRGDITAHPRDVEVESLLKRPPVRLDARKVAGFLRDRVVLVTGASGSIGREICRQVLTFRPSKIVLLDHNENGVFYLERELAELQAACPMVPCIGSIADAGRLRAVMAEHGVQVVFHAAAHKHVPMMEANPGEAVKNNVFGTKVLVDESIRAGVEALVMISTDKAVHPTSVMGACKRLAEMIVQARSAHVRTRLVTVRFGNVLGSAGSVVPIFKEQIRQEGVVTVTHPEMTRFFMTIPEAAQLVLQAGALGEGGEIFVLDMGEPVKVLDLAHELIRLSGLKVGRDVEIAYTGLRPGEKLYEELYDESEVRLPTPHPKIFRAQSRPITLDHIRGMLERMSGIVDSPPNAVRALLADVLPEYRHDRPAAHPVPTPPLAVPAFEPPATVILASLITV